MGPGSHSMNLWQNPLARKEYFAATAATLFLFASMVLVPIMGVFLGVLTPLPTLLFLYRWGTGVGLWLPATVGVMGSALCGYLGLTATLPFLLLLLLMGILLANGMRAGWSLERTVLTPAVALFVVGAGMFVAGLEGGEGGYVAALEKDVQSAVSEVVREFVADSPERSLLEHSLLAAVPTVVRLIPGAVFSSLLVIAWLNIMGARRYIFMHKLPWPSWGDWTAWKAPEQLVWGVIAAGFALLAPRFEIRMVALNILLVLGTVYFFQGLAVATFYFEKWKTPRFVRGIVLAFFLLQQFVTLGVMLFGFFDVWLDYRKIAHKK